MEKLQAAQVTSRGENYCIVVPHHDGWNHHTTKWFRSQHPDSWNSKFVRAAVQMESHPSGDVYSVLTWSNRPYARDPLLDC
ncbi:hypothetical protein [Mycobacteroides abscessus]|uniref:hypothetical protein n=1 Tax=Mycobacteroides abscessus TaxID=36809 RepID=UPI000C268F4E|nr:hypothetical protein [Mycobacteroides abscessus]PVB11751.1 hypothetical protein DDJ40_15280 [Mycobacteroides abscessus]RIR12436.1 hypothetical protein D2E27_13865 [Mycobacteroides abscessus]RIS55368.1 hypothetical protein D2E43_13995 [Mycobacteroides abscessus]